MRTILSRSALVFVLLATALPAMAQPVSPPPEKTRWLTGTLYGHDNKMAALRSIRITALPDDTYRIFIPNQFTFSCELSFDAKGFPAELRACKAYEKENQTWRVKEAKVALVCKTQPDREVLCQGAYTLASDVTESREHFTIARKP